MVKKAVIIYLDEDVIQDLDYICQELGRRRSALIREAVTDLLAKPKYEMIKARRWWKDVAENCD